MAVVNEVILKADGSEVATTIRDLRNNVKSYQNDLIGLDKASDEYRQTLNKLAASQGEITRITNATRAATLSNVQVFQQATSAVRGLVGGFQAFIGITALIGVENDNLAQTFVRLQASMAIVQSLSALSAGFRSLNMLIPRARQAVASFNATLLANPIIAIATAITAVGVALVAFIKNSNDATASQERFNDSITNGTEYANEFARQLQRNSTLLSAQGKSEIDVINNSTKAITDRIEELKNEYETITNLNSAYQERSGRTFIGDISPRSKEIEAEIEQLTSLLENYNFNLEVATARANRTQADAQQQSIDSFDDYFNRLIESGRNGVLNTANSLKDSAYEAIEDINNAILEIESNGLYEFEIPLFRDIIDFTSNEAIQSRRDAYQEEISNLTSFADDEVNSIEQRAAAFKRLEQIRDEYSEFNTKATSAEIANAKQAELQERASINARIAALTGYGSVISDVAGIVEENTVAYKALSVSSALIGAFAGQAQTLGDPTVPFWIKIPSALSILSAGLSAAFNIKDIDVSGNNNVPSAATNSTTIYKTIPALTNYEPDITPYVKELEERSDREINSITVKAVISETDIQESLNRTSEREINSTF